MTLKRKPYSSTVACRWVLVALCGFMIGPAFAQAPEEPDAKALLMGMAKFLAGTNSFSVNMRNGFDVPQDTGQMIEFNEKRSVTIKRPNQFRVEVEESDGEKQTVVFDGKQITVANSPQNVYAQADKSGTIDDAMIFFLRDLGMRLPLAAMLVNGFPAEMERRVSSVDYVEKTNILGAPAHHLAARTKAVDFQVWVSASDKPLPMRVVLTYKASPGEPQFWADFSNWNLTPVVAAETFAFRVPDDARRIPFLTEVAQLAAGATATGDKTGE